MPYPDGHSPPDDVLDRWLKLVDERFFHPNLSSNANANLSANVNANANANPSNRGDQSVDGGVSVGGASNDGGIGVGIGIGSSVGASNDGGIGNGSTVHTLDSLNINNNNKNNNNVSSSTGTGPTIAVHCVAGLGRAPVLVAIALIEFAKMEPVDAATFIRKHRRGAINNIQLDWLERYKRRYKTAGGGGCCIVM